MAQTRRILPLRIVIGVALVAAAMAIAWMALRPQTIDVDLAQVDRGAVEVTVGDDGIAAVRDTYEVAAPVAGRLLRIEVEAGDPVAANRTVLARMLPADPGFLDQRARAIALAGVAEADARRAAAAAMMNRAEAGQRAARQEYDRVSRLVQKGWMAPAALDNARAGRDETQAAAAAARAEAQAAAKALLRARSALDGPLGVGPNGAIVVTAPVSGKVLQIHRESEAVVPAGERLLTVGDPQGDLEVVADLLSADAVKVRPGARVSIEQWGGPGAISGRVRVVEPKAFLKISALGIEEQRVNVRIDMLEGPAERARLGHGYRVEVRIAVARAEDVLRVPVNALFRSGEDWAVFVREDGRARLRLVRPGLMNSRVAEVRAGLEEGADVVLFPAEAIEPGTRLRKREIP